LPVGFDTYTTSGLRVRVVDAGETFTVYLDETGECETGECETGEVETGECEDGRMLRRENVETGEYNTGECEDGRM
jgi:hypothetical protein